MRTAKRFVEFHACEIDEKKNDMSTTHSIDGFWRRFIATWARKILNLISFRIKKSVKNVHTTRRYQRSESPCSWILRSMPHVSDEDPANHSTVVGVDENDRPVWSAHATSDPSKQRVGSILGIFGPSCVAFWQNLARSQYGPYGHHFWATDVLEPTKLPFQARIGSINTNVVHYCQGTVVCDSEGCHGSDFGYFCRIWRGVFAVHAK